ncbi:hypothetical protein [Actinoplanes sp. M2I2]|uniref:hypothetical protein n=1 Tax=Actinoplanes sp. M2I2 TaxID=1734444 RepID=UPI002021DCB0|nr:hypothetical protein [Actinoplanes sp. M2I2]
MTDHHDFGHDGHDDFPIFEEPHADHYEPPPPDEHHDLYDTDDAPGPVEAPFEHHDDTPYAEPVAAEDHAALTGVTAEDPVDVFPATLDVGDLPEPVDGFPWIDTGSLGVVPAAALTETPDPVRPEELAEYAGVDLPPAQDPWAALADSDDPATSTLARWWNEN